MNSPKLVLSCEASFTAKKYRNTGFLLFLQKNYRFGGHFGEPDIVMAYHDKNTTAMRKNAGGSLADWGK